MRTAERLFALRGFDAVTDREIVAAAGHRNNSAIHYHFGSRTGLIAAIWHRHDAPVTVRRAELMMALAQGRAATLADLMRAHIDPLVVELLSHTPSYWARFTERRFLELPTRFLDGIETDLAARADSPQLEGLTTLLRTIQMRLEHLSADQAEERVALTIRWVIAALSCWERDVESGLAAAESLPECAENLVVLSVALLEAPARSPAVPAV